MKTELTPDQLKVLQSELRRAGANMWIPENCANSTCTFNHDGWCGLNNCQRQTCDVWQQPIYAPKPEKVAVWVVASVIVLAVVLAVAIYWPR